MLSSISNVLPIFNLEMIKSFQLRRIIASGKFIPEIDGLRFIAIMSVLLYHIHVFLAKKNLNTYEINQDNSFAPNFVFNGSLGVELFFVISGFVLGLFFANAYRNSKTINHKSYFLRRLTRLEPPYIISLLILFVGTVFVAKTYSFDESIKSLFASIFYVHNIVYPDIFPKIMTVAWSLEVEVQFYILAPILGLVFKIKQGINRKIILILLCLILPPASYFLPIPFVSVWDYLMYFLLGFLITDIYLDNKEKPKGKKNPWLPTLVIGILLGLFFSFKAEGDELLKMYYAYTHLLLLLVVFYIVLISRTVRILTKSWVSNIGGACYSIYLLHYPIISFLGNQLVKHQITNNKFIDNLIYGMILLVAVMISSMFFYVLIERPCMQRDWPRKLWNKIRPAN